MFEQMPAACRVRRRRRAGETVRSVGFCRAVVGERVDAERVAGRTGDLVPASLAPPVTLMLARAIDVIPEPGALPGGCGYELKLDGWRACVHRGPGRASVWSRAGTDLTVRFPDVAAAVTAQVPAGTVLDGELVMLDDDRLDFTGLQRRIGASPTTLARLVRARPAYYVAFDVLAHAGVDVRARPLVERRALLEDLAAGWAPPLNLSPMTTDRDTAVALFEHADAAGAEGIVVKGLAQPYLPGVRGWDKVKRHRELDVICAAVIGPITRPTVIVAGLPIDGELKVVGRTVPLSAAAVKALVPHLVPARGQHPWPARLPSSTVNGFGANREAVDLTLVEPIVVEVAADAAWSGRSFRHPLQARRARPDLDPAEVVLPDRLT